MSADHRGTASSRREHILNTADTRVSVVSAIAIGAVLLALSTPLVHAAPGDGPGSNNTPPPPGQVAVVEPLEISVSENPVVFLPHQTMKTINITWTPQPDSKVWVHVTEGSGAKEVWSKVMDKGLTGPLNLKVEYGAFYWIWVCREVHDTCPLAIVTTERLDIIEPSLERELPLPEPPGDNDRSTPQQTDGTGGQGPQRRPGDGSQEPGVGAADQQSRQE
jgi:hypothetical protein